MIKTLTLAALIGLSTISGAFAFDTYNAKLNTPAAKESLRQRVCANADGANLALCDRWAKTGVPDSDVRVGVVATGAVLGGAAGIVAAAVPVGALGGNTLIAQWGVTSVAGWAPTVAVVGTTGVLAGTVVGAGVAVSQ